MTRSKSRSFGSGSHLRNRNFPYVASMVLHAVSSRRLLSLYFVVTNVRRLLALILQPRETGGCNVSFSFHQIVQRGRNIGGRPVARIAQTFVRTRLAVFHDGHSQFRFSLAFHLGSPVSTFFPSSGSRARISRARY